VDAEQIVVLHDLLEALAVREVGLVLSSLGSADVRAAYREELADYLRQHEDRLAREMRERIDLNPLRAFDAADPATREVMAGAPQLLDRLSGEDADHFAEVRRLLDDAGVTYEIDPTLVRGLDYYTRTVFEFESARLGAQSGVAGGGRYDGLVEQLGGPPAAGCGWAAGVERLLLATDRPPIAEPVVELYVAYEEPEARATAFAAATAARRAGLNAQLELGGRSLKGQLKQADRLGARFVAIVRGELATLRDMESGEQRDVATDAIPAEVLRGHALP
jgi:histidyl-tRNA synthetase